MACEVKEQQRFDGENVLHKIEEFVLIRSMKFLACDKTVWLIATQRAHDQGDAKEKVVLLVNGEDRGIRWST